MRWKLYKDIISTVNFKDRIRILIKRNAILGTFSSLHWIITFTFFKFFRLLSTYLLKVFLILSTLIINIFKYNVSLNNSMTIFYIRKDFFLFAFFLVVSEIVTSLTKISYLIIKSDLIISYHITPLKK